MEEDSIGIELSPQIVQEASCARRVDRKREPHGATAFAHEAPERDRRVSFRVVRPLGEAESAARVRYPELLEIEREALRLAAIDVGDVITTVAAGMPEDLAALRIDCRSLQCRAGQPRGGAAAIRLTDVGELRRSRRRV